MKISEERIKWVLRDYEGVLKYCDARYANYRRSYICEKQELQNFVLPKIDFEPRSSSGGDKRDLSDLYESWTERQKKFQKELIDLMFEVEKEREEIHRIWLCFQMLPKKEYEILQKLYVDHRPYKEVELDSGISHRAFERIRKHDVESLDIVAHPSHAKISEICQVLSDLCRCSLYTVGNINRRHLLYIKLFHLT